ncbi:hypothetical protein GOBAR_AA00831 [Gossypium barbadense]|uniref:Piwi domain-containing protein n=1 Tax=Gossypium barbadense TaxID=3634 RepID=A0A2P5YVW4_GOSBA|nr:hypothetical protein GOBAR_AA00831 [Gossypium barbadense]
MLTLGQTTSIPVVSKVPTIILGMGALFGFPEQSDMPSIAAMVSSRRWPLIFSYGASGRKRKHDQIIIFRDGVSESQFNQVLIKLLRLASSLTRSGTLKIVVIVVQKPSYQVFFQQGSPDNVLHGTVIDNKICHPKNNDFYLGAPQPYLLWLLFATLIWQLDSWGQFMKIRDASETSSSHGGMYAPGVISVPQLSRLKDKVNNFIPVC